MNDQSRRQLPTVEINGRPHEQRTPPHEQRTPPHEQRTPPHEQRMTVEMNGRSHGQRMADLMDKECHLTDKE